MDFASMHLVLSPSKKRRMRAVAVRERLWRQQKMCADVSSVKQDYILYGVEQIFSTLLFMSSPYYADPQTSFNSFSDEKVDRERYTEFRVGADTYTGASCDVSSDARAELIVDKLVSLVGPPSDTLVGNEAAEDIADQIASMSEDGQADVCIGPEPVALSVDSVTLDIQNELSASADKFMCEARDIHKIVTLMEELRDYANFDAETHRELAAQSAGLSVKAKKLECLASESCASKPCHVDFYPKSYAFIDARDALRKDINSFMAEHGKVGGVTPHASSSKLASLSERMGDHQSIREPRPTKKTKQQKAKKFAK